MTEPWPWPVDLMIPLLPPSKVVTSWLISAILLTFLKFQLIIGFFCKLAPLSICFLKGSHRNITLPRFKLCFFYFLNPKTNGDDWCHKEYLNLFLEPFDPLQTSWSLKKQKLIKAERSENLSNISSKWNTKRNDEPLYSLLEIKGQILISTHLQHSHFFWSARFDKYFNFLCKKLRILRKIMLICQFVIFYR